MSAEDRYYCISNGFKIAVMDERIDGTNELAGVVRQWRD